ncbi:MAG TPA: hemolysin family protein [Gemmatimonadaceae bacterium]|nr:hemolysin family protein [Gemmatimonadaceae bacterium]
MITALVALLATVIAGLSAAADGALLGPDDRAAGTRRPVMPAAGQRDRTHRALAVARLITLLTAGAFAGLALQLDRHRPVAATGLAVLAAVVILIVGEILPRALGDTIGAPVLRALRPIIAPIELVVGPIAALGIALDAALHRAFPRQEPSEEDREDAAEQFRAVVQLEAEVPPDQQAILRRVFTLGRTEVHDVMVPRVDIVAIDHSAPWSEALDRVRSSEHARLPVYEESIDNVIGILYAKDLLPAIIEDAEPPAGWSALVRPASFIPEAKTADAQLRDFRATNTHIAIVVDEYGGTAGLVTIEDLLEEIVGDIRDEYDTEEPPIHAEEGRRFWVSGRVSLEDLSEALGHRFERDDVGTVGGLIYEVLGRVPRSGEEFTLEGFRVVVERVVRRRVQRVYFERIEALAERSA